MPTPLLPDGASPLPATVSPDSSVERRLGFYFLSMYGVLGLVGPFFAPWLHYRHVDAATIGLLTAAPPIAVVLTTLFLGGWADRLSDWRTAIIACDWLVLILFCWLIWHRDVLDVFVIWTLTGLLVMGKVPIVDGATLSLTRKRGTDYAKLRAIGSMGFTAMLLLAGYVYEHAGYAWFVPLLVTGALLRALCSHALPRFRSATLAAVPAPGLDGNLRHPGFLLVIGGTALITSSHAFFSAFGIVHWTEIGISASTSSALWCTAVLAEVLLMWKFKSVARRYPARHCLMLAAAAGLLRWSGTALEPSVAWLFVLQALHGLSFGLAFVAVVSFISRRVDDKDAARAQALSTTLATAVLALAFLLSGWVYEAVGVRGYWFMAALCVAGGLLVALSYRTNLDELLDDGATA